MRILFLAFRDPLSPYQGGGDVYVSELAKGCAASGHRVTMISCRFPRSKKEEFVEGIHIIRLGNRFTMFIEVFTYYLKNLRGDFDVVVEEIIGGPRFPFFASLYMKEKLIGILQQRHREIFRHQFKLPLAYLLSFLERFLVLLYRKKIVIVNSSKTLQDLSEIGFRKEMMPVIQPGLPEWFSGRCAPDFSARYPRVTCVSKIRRYKLLDCAVRAMKDVCETMPDCELIIAGRTNEVEPDYEQELRCLIEELGLSANVFLRKDIDEKEKIDLLSTSRAFVLPSAIEGFGIAVIEANACGTPVVVSDRIPRDAALNGYNALVVPCYDISSTSKAILSLMSDEKMWRKLSSNSVGWVRKFSWKRSVQDFLRVVENA